MDAWRVVSRRYLVGVEGVFLNLNYAFTRQTPFPLKPKQVALRVIKLNPILGNRGHYRGLNLRNTQIDQPFQ